MAFRWPILLAACLGCDGTPVQPICQHPCDLAQTARVEIIGSQAAASLSVTGPCRSDRTCPAKEGCRTVNITFVPMGFTGSQDASELLCHLTATSAAGATIERDLVVRYTAGTCCSGYEFTTPAITIAF